MSLVYAVLGTFLLWQLAHWRPRVAEFSREAAGDLWPYSSRVLGFNMFKAFAQNTDRLIIGPLLGVHAVGVYTFASKVAIFPVTIFVGALGAYLFPRVARVQGDPSGVRAIYRKVMIAVLNVVLPLASLVVLALAPAAVPLLGERWREAAPVIQVLAVAASGPGGDRPGRAAHEGAGSAGMAGDLVHWLYPITSAALWIGVPLGAAGHQRRLCRRASVAAIPVILWIGWRLTGLGPSVPASPSRGGPGWPPPLWRRVSASPCGTRRPGIGRHGDRGLAVGAIYLVVLAA